MAWVLSVAVLVYLEQAQTLSLHILLIVAGDSPAGEQTVLTPVKAEKAENNHHIHKFKRKKV